MKKRALIVLNYYYPYISGVSEFARLIAEGLCGDFDVTVLTGQHCQDLPLHETINHVHVVRSRLLLRLHKGYISPEFIWNFRRLARTADVVHLHLPMLEAGLFVKLCPRSKSIVSYQCDGALTGGLIDRAAI